MIERQPSSEAIPLWKFFSVRFDDCQKWIHFAVFKNLFPVQPKIQNIVIK